MLAAAGFTGINIQVKENAADIIKGWMPGSGAEKYITSAYVTASKPMGGNAVKDTLAAVVHELPAAVAAKDTASKPTGC